MIRDITIGQFFPGRSFVHRMDARTKLLLTILLLVLIFVCRNFWSLCLIAVFSFAVFFLARLSPKLIFKSFKPLLPIVILTSLLQLYYNNSGTVYWQWHKLTLTSGGIHMAIFIAARIFILLLLSSLLTYTTSPTDLTDGLERLLSPLKLFHADVHTFSMMMTIALRFIPTLIDEIDRIMSAQKARGADFETGNVVRRVKALFPIFIPLFVSSFKRAFELADAMSCRCYTGGEGRTRMKQMRFSWRDALGTAICLGLMAGIITLNVLFPGVI